MPLTRCLIRNEFKLADSDLYTASDKNDPGAIFEGVAVAGLVGVLRQLGDLAQFSAEMFHDLHEDVTAMAARGHGLMDRIHNLETHVSSVEMSLLSMTDHTEFYYNTDIVWHPQMSAEENLIDQKSVPRFIRDCYEECHAPPPLHLLDKFDINGAGACLKRFTDPSFFKARKTAAEAGKLDAERDWKTQKLKKKGSCWRNGDNSEAARGKLHQLLHEDRAKNNRKPPTRRVSFKMMNLDSSRSSESYMQEFLQIMSPEHSAALETEVGRGLASVAEDSIYFSSVDSESNPYDINHIQRNKDFTSGYNGVNKNGVICSSDGIAMEDDTCALADVEFELDTDNKYIPAQSNGYRCKNEHLYSISNEGGICASKEHGQKFLDFQSVGNSNTSDDGSGSFIQETSPSRLRGVYDKRRTDDMDMEHGDGQAVPFTSTESFVEEDTNSNPVSPGFNFRTSLEQISDGFEQKSYGSYWADAAASALLGLNLGSVGPTKTQDPPSEYNQDTEAHVESNKLFHERNPAHSRTWGSGQISISVSDQQEAGSQCSSSISPRYLMDTNSSCERSQDVSFVQYDDNQDMKPLDDTVNDSTSLKTSNWNSELTNHPYTYSSQESHMHIDEEVKKPREGQASEVSSHTFIQNLGRFPLPADSTQLVENTVDTDGQHSHLRLEEVETASDVPVRSKDQCSEDSELYRKDEEVQSPKEKIIQCVETHGPRVWNEEHFNKEINSPKPEVLRSSGEKPAAKKNTPHNPRIETVGALDRTKFKKVTSRNRLETMHIESVDALDKSKSRNVTPNAGGRDRILEVIRAKSFNLKPAPAPVSKPFVRAPTMNIKVSAILEKANRIRQATTGSDEEDEWSD